MIEKEIIIIDKTLVVLEALYKDKLIKKIPLLRTLIRLLHEIGSDYGED
ncbi:homocitrate synthase NifV [Clostridium saccharoperbutylacetonicum]|uniref:Uncharacterized protein n=1 Tax=Clostridium saccharoperbutylacetonicum N1-4(HMT) TaxID=931276 RepID=M1MQ49_9CLOT|nr:hypothetical protein [Clostridium saccharoperbutylacetonicum]AGF56861.1 hypothetical protein Cspa_c31000 [Clostridium saccharoperbutylacetonicum N1-4(HMT)]NRT62381.1 homocitrate synthase NifV [Clostridium saccharoperbutylacetonicum]NSB25721.1 homocitrate synthase NifV [Clostridium saccharoperbutylacetonicum]NSB45087.1 homocitrate synthase NifV [Clostridium saccharoperbutylacetonicum]